MVRVKHITKDWKEAGSFPAQINLYGFWDEHSFLTKSGDLGAVLKIGGIDYESLDHAGRDYAVKRLEAALRSLDDRCRLYQILFKHNRPAIPHAEYENPLVRAAVEQRAAFLQSRADHLYSIEVYWTVMIDGSYAKTGLLHALAQLPKQPGASLRDLRGLFSGNKERTLIYEQIERDRLRLQQKVQSLSGQLNDLMTVTLPGAEETFRILRRLVNFRPSKNQDARLYSARHIDGQLCDSELEAHRGYLRMDDDYLRVLTLKELPSETRPLLLQGLLDVPANFHVVTEWHPVDNARARKEIASRRRHHHNSKTSFVSNLQDRQNTGPKDELVDDSKEAAVAELGSALTALGMEGKNFGEFTLSVVIYDEDRVKVEHTVAEFQKLFTQHDGLLYEERYNLLNAFFATVPGNRQFNLRKQWALNSNYADLSFLFTIDTGSKWNPRLDKEYLAVLESTHGTPYYLNLHWGDVPNAFILGAIGSGKSFTTNFIIQSAQKYNPLTFVFDLGASYQMLTQSFGGSYLNVGLKDPGFTINPFSLDPTHENQNFLYLFLRVLIEAGGRYDLTPEDEKALFAGIERVYKLPREIRILTNFASILADAEKALAFKARFASNLVSGNDTIPGATSSAPAPSAATGTPSANNPSAPSTVPASQHSDPDAKRAPEVNVNSAHGQPYVLFEGTTIDTSLVTRLDGEFVGSVKVMVTNPVYSRDRQHVLIPEGTFFLGNAQKVSGFGQKRLAVAFHRMIMPDGYNVDLDQFHGLDQAGETGLKDKVNNNYLQIFGASIALGIIAGAAEATTNSGYEENGSSMYRQGMAESLASSGANVLDKFINIPPTITIREGHRIKIYLTQDMLLPAYENHDMPGVM